MSIPKPFNLLKWVDENQHEFKKPVMNKQFYVEADDVIVFVSVGPNTRNDYHVNPTEELFYQFRGDIVIRLRPLDGEPYDQVVKEGEMFLIPRHVPHRPQRPANTLGLIVEFPRPVEGTQDKLQWYCPDDVHLVYEAEFRLEKIDEDLHKIMDEFWNGPEENRTCKETGKVIVRPPDFEIASN